MISWKSAPPAIKSKSTAPTTGSSILRLDSPIGWNIPAGADPETALKISSVYGCVNVIAGGIAEMPVSVKNWATKEDIKDHYLGKVLWVRPNEAMTPFVYKHLVETNRLLRGNGYSYIHRDGNGRPVELIPLYSDYVSVNINSSGKLWYGYMDPRSGKAFQLDPMQMLHYKNFSLDGLTGLSTLRFAALTIATAEAREKYDYAVYANGGRPAGVLQTDSDLSGKKIKVSSDGEQKEVFYRDVVRNEWERVHGGAANAFRVAVLDLGLKYTPIGLTNADAQFVENKEISIFDICRFFGVPPHKVYAGKQSYESNDANNIDFVTDTMQPIVTGYEEEDKWKLLAADELDDGLVINRNMLVSLRGNTSARANWYTSMRNLGVYSVNDIRDKEEETAVPGGDTRYANLNNVPLEYFEILSILRNIGNAKKEGEPTRDN